MLSWKLLLTVSTLHNRMTKSHNYIIRISILQIVAWIISNFWLQHTYSITNMFIFVLDSQTHSTINDWSIPKCCISNALINTYLQNKYKSHLEHNKLKTPPGHAVCTHLHLLDSWSQKINVCDLKCAITF